MLWYGAIQNNTLPSKGNARKERFIQTLLSTLRSFPRKPEIQKSRWKDSLNNTCLLLYPSWRHWILIIICCVVSPQHFLLILFLELLKPASSTKYLAYVREWKKAMKEAYELAANRYRLSRMKGKRQYKRKDKSPVLRPGDRVSKKYTRKRRTWKIVILLGAGNLWSNQAESRKKPIYEVEPESGEGLRRVIHSSLLLPCNEFSFQRKTVDPARRPTQKRKITRPAVLSTPSPASETSSDEEA